MTLLQHFYKNLIVERVVWSVDDLQDNIKMHLTEAVYVRQLSN
jgi:hypothetical protein